MTPHWRVSAPRPNPACERAYDSREEADAAGWSVQNSVVWWCEGVPETREVHPEPVVALPVALGSIRRLFARQTENNNRESA